MAAMPFGQSLPSVPMVGPLAGTQLSGMQRDDLDSVSHAETLIYPFPWSRGNFSDCLVSGYDAWVLYREAELLAYAVLMWIPDEIHLLNLSVLPHWQGRGIGRALLQVLLEDGRRRGARGMMLEVRPSNSIAASLYESMEFQQIGLRKRYYPSWNQGREDARVMFKTFQP